MTKLVEVDVDDLRLAEDNVRSTTNQDGLEGLAQSIAAQGVLEPIVVSPPMEGGIRMVHFGARRVLAIDLINKNPEKYNAEPIRTLDCIEKMFENDGERIAASLIENLQREDIDPIDEAKGYFRLTTECAYSQSEIAQRIGRNRSHVSKYLSLLSLPESTQDHVAEGNITLELAWKLVKLATKPDVIEKLVNDETGAVSTYAIDDALTKVENQEALEAAAKRLAQSTDLPIVHTKSKASKPKSDKPFASMGEAVELARWDGTIPEGAGYVQLTKETWQHDVAVKFFTDDEAHIDLTKMGWSDKQKYQAEAAKKNPEPETESDYGESQIDPDAQRRMITVQQQLREARLAHEQARMTAVAHGKLTLAGLVELVYPIMAEDYGNYAVDPVELVKVGRVKLPGVTDPDEFDIDELGDKIVEWAETNKARFVHLMALFLGRHEQSTEALLDKALPPFDEDKVKAELELAYDNLQALEPTGTEE